MTMSALNRHEYAYQQTIEEWMYTHATQTYNQIEYVIHCLLVLLLCPHRLVKRSVITHQTHYIHHLIHHLTNYIKTKVFNSAVIIIKKVKLRNKNTLFSNLMQLCTCIYCNCNNRVAKFDLVTIFNCDFCWYCAINYVIVN